MDNAKPALIPARVPWSISASVPHLKLEATKEGAPNFLTFIGYFKLNDKSENSDGFSVEVVNDPGEFRMNTGSDEAPYRLVRVTFEGGVKFRECFSVSDHEVIPQATYDWSEVVGALRPDEDVLGNLERTQEYWIRAGQSPDPGFYEVRNSPWIKEIGVNDPSLHHYIATGHDEYFEVLARGWHWEAGQAA